MEFIDQHFKNSNTGVMIKKVITKSTVIKGIPDRYYDINGQPVESPDLTGFVPLSEKKFLLAAKKLKSVKN